MDEINVNNLLRNLLAATAKSGGIKPSTFNLSKNKKEVMGDTDSKLSDFEIPDQYRLSPDGSTLVKKGAGGTGIPRFVGGGLDKVASLFNIKQIEPITGLPVPLDIDKKDPISVAAVNKILEGQGQVLEGTGASQTDPLGSLSDTLGVIREDQAKSAAQSIFQQGAAINALNPLYQGIADQGMQRAFQARQLRDTLPSEVQGRIRMANLDSALQQTAKAAQTQAAKVFQNQLKTMNLS